MTSKHPLEAAVRLALQRGAIVALPRKAPYSREGLRVQGSIAGNVRIYADQGGREGRKRLLDRVEAALTAEGMTFRRLDEDTINVVPPHLGRSIIAVVRPE